MGSKASAAAAPATSMTAPPPDGRFDWRRIAYNALVSRALDDVEEATNKNRATVPREHLVLYQFSARGHDVAQSILGSLLTHPHDAASAYYRSRPLLLALGLSIEDALASPLGRIRRLQRRARHRRRVQPAEPQWSRSCCRCPATSARSSLRAAGWAQSIRYHADVLDDASWKGAIGVVLGGEGSVATNGFWSALTMATTLSLPMLFYIEDNGLGISVRGDMQTPGGDIARNLASFGNLLVRDGDGTNPAEAAALLAEGVAHVRARRRAGARAAHRAATLQPLGPRQPARLSHRRRDRRRCSARSDARGCARISCPRS